jgi:hypothetical protein
MAMPHHRDHDDTPLKRPRSARRKIAVAGIAVLLAAFVALHIAGVFGP